MGRKGLCLRGENPRQSSVSVSPRVKKKRKKLRDMTVVGILKEICMQGREGCESLLGTLGVCCVVTVTRVNSSCQAQISRFTLYI